jgi:uncharacterized metal-binding protein
VPSGRVHEAINTGALGLGSAAYWVFQQDIAISQPVAVAFVGSFLLGTFLITPDLDLAERQVQAKGRWGWLGLFWVPYGWIFSHRGLSHTWIVGPLTRIMYLGGMGVALYWLITAITDYVGVSLDVQAQLEVPPPEVLWALVLGYYASQWLHLIADGIWPDSRLLRRRR